MDSTKKVVKNNLFYQYIKYRKVTTPVIKPSYVNIMIHPKDAAMVTNVNSLMEEMNCVSQMIIICRALTTR